MRSRNAPHQVERHGADFLFPVEMQAHRSSRIDARNVVPLKKIGFVWISPLAYAHNGRIPRMSNEQSPQNSYRAGRGCARSAVRLFRSTAANESPPNRIPK